MNKIALICFCIVCMALTCQVQAAPLSKIEQLGKIMYKDNPYLLSKIEDIKRLISELENEYTSKKNENLSYWDMVYAININLCSLLVSYEKKKDMKHWSAIKKGYKDLL